MANARKRKVIEVEGVAPRDVPKPKAPLVVKVQDAPEPLFVEGEKVRYMSSYGKSLTPYRWEPRPYRILSRSLQYDWLNEMNYAYAYRLRRWDADVERQGWAAWDTVTAWELQLLPWVDEPLSKYPAVLGVLIETIKELQGSNVVPSPLCVEELEPLDEGDENNGAS